MRNAARNEVAATLALLTDGVGWLSNAQGASHSFYDVARAVHSLCNAANPYTIPGAIVPSAVSTGRTIVRFEDGTVLDFD